MMRQGGEAGLALSPRIYVMMKTLMATDSLGRGVSRDFNLTEVLTTVFMRAMEEGMPDIPESILERWREKRRSKPTDSGKAD